MISLFGVQGLGVLPQSFILLVSPYSVHDTNLLGEVAKTLNPKPSLQTYCGLDKLPTHLSSIRNLHYIEISSLRFVLDWKKKRPSLLRSVPQGPAQDKAPPEEVTSAEDPMSSYERALLGSYTGDSKEIRQEFLVETSQFIVFLECRGGNVYYSNIFLQPPAAWEFCCMGSPTSKKSCHVTNSICLE